MNHPILGHLYCIKYRHPECPDEVSNWNSFRVRNPGTIEDMKRSLERIAHRFPGIRPDHFWAEWWNDDAGKWIPVTLFKSPYALFSED